MPKKDTYKEYAEKVVSGEIVSGELMRLACKRYLSWFERGDMDFVPDNAERVINFCEHLKQSTGKFNGKPLKLADWQKFIIYHIYGFVWKSTGKRVIRNAYLQLSRKSGKSTLSAALALYHLCADGEQEAQVIFAANSAAQATLAFTMAQNFVTSLPYSERFFKRYRDSIRFKSTKSSMKVVSADSTKLDGLNVSMYVIDEYHAAPDSSVADVLETATGMREQPLGITITTAGFDLTCPCYELRNTCVNILHGKAIDDSQAAFIFELDPNDNVEDEGNWVKCQPNLGLTVTKDYLRQQLQKVKNTPSMMVNFKTKLMNLWCSSKVGEWIQSEYILKCSEKISLTDEKFEGCFGILGLDLSSVSDMTALSMLIAIEDDYFVKNYYFLPESALEESANRDKYRKWMQQGFLNITQGNVIDYEAIKTKIQEINAQLPIETISYDAWQSTALIVKLTEEGFNCQPYSQSIGSMNRPTKFIETIARNGQLHLDNNPITAWMFANVVIKADYNGNVKPVKSNHSSEYKIDGIVAMIDALGCWLSKYHYDNTIFTFNFDEAT